MAFETVGDGVESADEGDWVVGAIAVEIVGVADGSGTSVEDMVCRD